MPSADWREKLRARLVEEDARLQAEVQKLGAADERIDALLKPVLESLEPILRDHGRAVYVNQSALEDEEAVYSGYGVEIRRGPTIEFVFYVLVMADGRIGWLYEDGRDSTFMASHGPYGLGANADLAEMIASTYADSLKHARPGFCLVAESAEGDEHRIGFTVRPME